MTGDFVEKNVEEALKLLMQSAEQGNYSAQYELGEYYSAEGPQQDMKKADMWFAKVAETQRNDFDP